MWIRLKKVKSDPPLETLQNNLSQQMQQHKQGEEDDSTASHEPHKDRWIKSAWESSVRFLKVILHSWRWDMNVQHPLSSPPLSLYSVLLLAFDNDFKDIGKIHHLGEHLHDVRMISGSADELLQCQLAWWHKQKKKKIKTHQNQPKTTNPTSAEMAGASERT